MTLSPLPPPGPSIEAWMVVGGAALAALIALSLRFGGGWLLALGMRLGPAAAGIRRRRIGGWLTLETAPRGAPTAPPLVVLHGLGVRKETMISLLVGCRGPRRVLAPDLPGFGEHRLAAELERRITRAGFAPGEKPRFEEVLARTPGSEAAAYLDAVVAWIERSVEGPFDLAGASMGGALAASVAARLPDRVERLVLLGPAGVRAPRANEFMREVESDRNPLEIHGVADLDRVIGLNFVRPPRIPRFIRRALAADLRLRQPAQELVVDALGPLLLDGLREVLPRVRAETLLLWGACDAILDCSAAAIFESLLERVTVEIVPDAGHTLHGDCPRIVMPRIRAFLDRG